MEALSGLHKNDSDHPCHTPPCVCPKESRDVQCQQTVPWAPREVWSGHLASVVEYLILVF